MSDYIINEMDTDYTKNCLEIRKVDCDFKHPYDKKGNPFSLERDRERANEEWVSDREHNSHMSLSEFEEYYGEQPNDKTHMPIAKNPQCIIFYDWCEGGDYPISQVFRSVEDAAVWSCMYFLPWEFEGEYNRLSYNFMLGYLSDFLNEDCLYRDLF